MSIVTMLWFILHMIVTRYSSSDIVKQQSNPKPTLLSLSTYVLSKTHCEKQINLKKFLIINITKINSSKVQGSENISFERTIFIKLCK